MPGVKLVIRPSDFAIRSRKVSLPPGAFRSSENDSLSVFCELNRAGAVVATLARSAAWDSAAAAAAACRSARNRDCSPARCGRPRRRDRRGCARPSARPRRWSVRRCESRTAAGPATARDGLSAGESLERSSISVLPPFASSTQRGAGVGDAPRRTAHAELRSERKPRTVWRLHRVPEVAHLQMLGVGTKLVRLEAACGDDALRLQAH